MFLSNCLVSLVVFLIPVGLFDFPKMLDRQQLINT